MSDREGVSRELWELFIRNDPKQPEELIGRLDDSFPGPWSDLFSIGDSSSTAAGNTTLTARRLIVHDFTRDASILSATQSDRALRGDSHWEQLQLRGAGDHDGKKLKGDHRPIPT